MNTKVIFIDIDGTVCTEERTFERSLAQPIEGAQEKINMWYNEGHTIVFWTARGWEQYKITKKWLDDNGFLYHQILMGKPQATVFIDDRAVNFKGWNYNYF